MPKRIFIAFAIEDQFLRDALRGQARNSATPFDFVDMSAKEPWDSSWKTHCRTRIRGCDGTVAIITSNTRNAEGQLWEIRCSQKEGVPVLFLDGNGSVTRAPAPNETKGLVPWTWANVSAFLSRI